MKTFRYLLTLAFLLAPALVMAQGGPDSLTVDIGVAENLAAYEAAFGAQFPSEPPNQTFGPFEFVPVESEPNPDEPDASPEDGCGPLTADNAAAVEGNVAFVERGFCPFVLKVQNASAAGAEYVIVYNCTIGEDGCGSDNDDALLIMAGDCDPDEDGCTAPAAFVSRNSALAILDEIKFGEEGTITCEICTEPPPAPTAAPLGTGTVETGFFDNGFIGTAPNGDQAFGFSFMGDEGLFRASVVIGQDGLVEGSPYATASEFVAVEEVTPLSDPDNPPNYDFDQAITTRFSSAGDPGIPVGVRLNGYARDGDPFVFLDIILDNTLGEEVEDVYAGIFADWDVGGEAFEMNNGGYDEESQLLYVFNTDGTTANYFGLVAISEEVSGWTLATDPEASDDSIFDALTSDGDELTEDQDVRTVLGVGSFDVSVDDRVQARFAMVAGESLDAIIANAEAAQDVGALASEVVTPQGTFLLGSAYPNPFSSSTRIGFELPAAQDVTLTVYDVLGREVAVLMNGVAQAGKTFVDFDAASLPSGVYFYRLDAGATQLTERMTVVR